MFEVILNRGWTRSVWLSHRWKHRCIMELVHGVKKEKEKDSLLISRRLFSNQNNINFHPLDTHTYIHTLLLSCASRVYTSHIIHTLHSLYTHYTLSRMQTRERARSTNSRLCALTHTPALLLAWAPRRVHAASMTPIHSTPTQPWARHKCHDDVAKVHGCTFHIWGFFWRSAVIYSESTRMQNTANRLST